MHVAAPTRSTCRCDGRLLPRIQRAGDLDVMPPTSYALWHDEGPSVILAMRVKPWLLASVAETVGASIPDAGPELHVRDPRVEHIGWALKAELEDAQGGGRLYAESLGVALCVQLLCRYTGKGLRTATSLPKRRIRRAIDYIHTHLDADLSLIELASVSGLSPSHFQAVFKESAGVSVHQYVLRTRVDLAIRLISQGQLPLRDIAAQIGFCDQSHMVRCVRKVTGKTPTVIRRESLRE
jgi:AraC family transcriptional regulator